MTTVETSFGKEPSNTEQPGDQTVHLNERKKKTFKKDLEIDSEGLEIKHPRKVKPSQSFL